MKIEFEIQECLLSLVKDSLILQSQICTYLDKYRKYLHNDTNERLSFLYRNIANESKDCVRKFSIEDQTKKIIEDQVSEALCQMIEKMKDKT